MFDEEAIFLYVVNDKDEDGFPVEYTESVKMYVRPKSATRTEFYEALRTGITVSMEFECRIEDWELTKHITANGKAAYATRVQYDGATYDIIRTYRNDKSMISVICA